MADIKGSEDLSTLVPLHASATVVAADHPDIVPTDETVIIASARQTATVSVIYIGDVDIHATGVDTFTTTSAN